MNFDLSYKMGFNKKSSRKWSLEMGVGKNEFFDDQFNVRESDHLGLTLNYQRKHATGAKRLSSTGKVALRNDWLYSTGDREVGFFNINISGIDCI